MMNTFTRLSNWLRACCMLAGVFLLAPTASALDMSAYQLPDGAITVHPGGNNVDPYFAMKALWAARTLNDPSGHESHAWIAWLLPRQHDDGNFARYCRQDAQWRDCAAADADDALLAMWIALLHESAPRDMPPSWRTSIRRAEQALLQLKTPEGVYRAGPQHRDALLMDNVEIYDALRRTGQLRAQAGDRIGGQRYLEQAHRLRLSMRSVFHADADGILHWSSGDISSNGFYPHALAHLYPWLHRMDIDGFGDAINWQTWLTRYGETWLTRSGDAFPWGAVALLAYRQNSFDAVRRWLDAASPLRGTANWNVLEEAAYQGLARARLEQSWK